MTAVGMNRSYKDGNPITGPVRVPVRIVAKATTDSHYVDLYFEGAEYPFETINVWDYRTGKSEVVLTPSGKSVSKPWLRETLREWLHTQDVEEMTYQTKEYGEDPHDYTRQRHPRTWLKQYVNNCL